MQLIVILLATVSLLTLLSGVIVFFGARKKDRVRSFWFMLAAIFATIWMVSLIFFMTVGTPEELNYHTAWVFATAILLDVTFLGYVGWQKKYGRIVTIVFLVIGAIVAGWIAISPNSLYNNMTISNNGNYVEIIFGPLFFAYIGFFGAIVPAIMFMHFKQFMDSVSKYRIGEMVNMGAYGISSLIILICNLILPIFGNWALSWLGPLSLALTIISVYYTILRYKMVLFNSIWLRIFSYVVIIASIAIVYMIIFSLIFAALFRGSSPSIEVIVLNFIMILIFLSLTPVINNLMLSVRVLSDGYRRHDHKDDETKDEDE